MNEKVSQAINYGSPYEALISGFVTCEEILTYLLTQSINAKNMIAYRAVCQLDMIQLVNENHQENEEVPFITITEHDEYVGIYL